MSESKQHVVLLYDVLQPAGPDRDRHKINLRDATARAVSLLDGLCPRGAHSSLSFTFYSSGSKSIETVRETLLNKPQAGKRTAYASSSLSSMGSVSQLAPSQHAIQALVHGLLQSRCLLLQCRARA